MKYKTNFCVFIAYLLYSLFVLAGCREESIFVNNQKKAFNVITALHILDCSSDGDKIAVLAITDNISGTESVSHLKCGVFQRDLGRMIYVPDCEAVGSASFRPGFQEEFVICDIHKGLCYCIIRNDRIIVKPLYQPTDFIVMYSSWDPSGRYIALDLYPAKSVNCDSTTKPSNEDGNFLGIYDFYEKILYRTDIRKLTGRPLWHDGNIVVRTCSGVMWVSPPPDSRAVKFVELKNVYQLGFNYGCLFATTRDNNKFYLFKDNGFIPLETINIPIYYCIFSEDRCLFSTKNKLVILNDRHEPELFVKLDDPKLKAQLGHWCSLRKEALLVNRRTAIIAIPQSSRKYNILWRANQPDAN